MPKPSPGRRYTPNQIVAWNLRRARQLRGWTQDQAAERLEPYLGERWSKATFSIAERSSERPSAESGRIRQFTADDIAALASAFNLTIPFFFTPPVSNVKPVPPSSVYDIGPVQADKVLSAYEFKEIARRAGDEEADAYQAREAIVFDSDDPTDLVRWL